MFSKEKVFNLHRLFDTYWHAKKRKKDAIKVRDHYIQYNEDTGSFTVFYGYIAILRLTPGGFAIDLKRVIRRSRAAKIINNYMNSARVGVAVIGYGNCNFITYAANFREKTPEKRLRPWDRGVAGHRSVLFETGVDGRVRQLITDCGAIDNCDCQFMSRGKMRWMNKLNEVGVYE